MNGIGNLITGKEVSNTADNIDAMLQGEDQTPASPAQNDQVSNPIEGQTPEEEAEFNKLNGSTQERFKKILNRARQAEEKAQRLESQIGSVPPPPPGANLQSPDVQNAVRQLENVGVATQDFVKNEVNTTLANLRYEQEMQRLESNFTGSKGEPTFVREEYEDYVRSHPQFRNYLPEDVFKSKMFHDEFLNLELGSKQTPASSGNNTLRPTRTSVQREELTPETIEEKLKNLPPAEAKQWYSDNLDKINSVLGREQV